MSALLPASAELPHSQAGSSQHSKLTLAPPAHLQTRLFKKSEALQSAWVHTRLPMAAHADSFLEQCNVEKGSRRVISLQERHEVIESLDHMGCSSSVGWVVHLVHLCVRTACSCPHSVSSQLLPGWAWDSWQLSTGVARLTGSAVVAGGLAPSSAAHSTCALPHVVHAGACSCPMQQAPCPVKSR